MRACLRVLVCPVIVCVFVRACDCMYAYALNVFYIYGQTTTQTNLSKSFGGIIPYYFPLYIHSVLHNVTFSKRVSLQIAILHARGLK